MKTLRYAIAAASLLALTPVQAALAPGAKAPDFTTQASLAGKPFSFTLSRALKKGPVVLYFYPKAFTKGCTIEANMFAEATPDFAKAGATVIGVSADEIGVLNEFSRKECRDKFAVASATPAMIKAYDVVFAKSPNLSDRTSYVIAPNGKIIYVHSELNPADHVKNTLAAVRDWRAKHRG
ncbi:peroxiredoxin [Sphingomonas colocasiae]|uniref:thioredoxin-dependent peroxiredoxin n=1 Tax=Sphingomonas colocasiae TaxID=1848973 RepID=A0ABS7PUC4_9SPHN|nr:peroxiredoxin [Sphingomonas colocasiae]MBY8824746.1 peroxiredoxin [Sphingomonas colocasiae]